ncbi:MAG: pseudouridine synthase, partial [Roseibacillus sp.]|nr:pseudouridine synthase [Roseibacillus sp.]
MFEDNHLLAVEKPINLLSQADHSGSSDLLSLLKDWIKQRDQKPGQVFLGLVQRLDRPVGGVMVFAKTSKAASRLADQVRQRTLQKTYLAVVAGVIDPPEGTLTDWLEKNHHNNTVRVVASGLPPAKQAMSEAHSSLILAGTFLSMFSGKRRSSSQAMSSEVKISP